MNKSLVLLIAAERSGTHYFRSIVNNNKAGHAYWEIANAESPPDDNDLLNFFIFKSKCQMNHKDYPRPTVALTRDLINLYFDYCIEFSKNHKLPLILDIKYAHLINFTNGWWDFIGRPLIFDIAAERNIQTIHLRRKNLYKTALSNIYAAATNLWKIQGNNLANTIPISVSREKLVNNKLILEQNLLLVEKWLEPCNPIEIYYEDLNVLPSPSWDKLRSILSNEILNVESEYIKVLKDYKSQITNYDEISDLIQSL